MGAGLRRAWVPGRIPGGRKLGRITGARVPVSVSRGRETAGISRDREATGMTRGWEAAGITGTWVAYAPPDLASVQTEPWSKTSLKPIHPGVKKSSCGIIDGFALAIESMVPKWN